MFLKPVYLDEVEDTDTGVGDVEQKQVQRDIVERLAAQGRDVSSFESDDDLLSALGEGYDKLQKVSEYERELESLRPVANEYYAHTEDFERIREEKKKPKETEAKEPVYNPPAIPRQYLNLLEKDTKTGMYRPPRDMPELSAVARKANERKQYEEEFFGGFREDPTSFIDKVYQPKLEERLKTVEERIFQRLQQEQSVRQQNEFLLQQETLWERDENGQPKLQYDPATQQQQLVLSEEGRLLQHFAQQARQQGVPEHLVIQTAMDQKDLYLLRQGTERKAEGKTAETPQEPPTAEQKKRDFIDSRRIPAGAGRTSSRAGGELLEEEEFKPSPNMSFADIAKKEFEKAGIPLN